MKTIKITNAHSDHKPTQVMNLSLEGGSPWFAYIWIDDVLYTLTMGDKKVVKIKRTK